MNECEERELVEWIHRSFDAQELPPRPDDEETMAMLTVPEKRPAVVPPIAPVRESVWAMTLPVAVVVALIAAAIWLGRPEAEDSRITEAVAAQETEAMPDTEMTPDIEAMPETQTLPVTERQDDAPAVVVASDQGQVGTIVTEQAPPAQVDKKQTDKEQAELEPAPQKSPARPGKLRQLIEYANGGLQNRKWDLDVLAKALQPHLKAESPDALRAGLEAMGLPSGVSRVRQVVVGGNSWLLPEGRVGYRYDVRISDLISNARAFVNALVGDEVFEPILEGIRDDREGPRVDLRAELFAYIGGHVLLTVDESVGSREERILLAVKIENEPVVRKTIAKLYASEPDLKTESHGSSAIFHTTDQNATTVVSGYILFGEINLVRDTLRRAQGKK